MSKDYRSKKNFKTTELFCQDSQKLKEVLQVCGIPLPQSNMKRALADKIVEFVEKECPDACLYID